MRYVIVALVSILAISAALWKLASTRTGVAIESRQVGTTPVTIFRPSSGEAGPMIVIAHGFAGSQQLMQPFALTLARNGYVAVTFDFLGHGRNPDVLPGGLTDQNASLQALLRQLNEVAAFAETLQPAGTHIALLGHSMASDIVVRHAMAHPDIAATIAVSVFAPDVTAASPRNLLVIDGDWEPSFLKDEGRRIAGQAAQGPVQTGVTYGDFSKGTARRLVFARDVEHIGVLYSADSMAAALDWLNQVYGRKSGGFTDVCGPWLGLLFAGLIALAWPLARWLPVVSAAPRGAVMSWRKLLPVAIAPAVLTPLLLWKLPTDFLPLLLGDYLVLHFALYGLLTAIALWLSRGRQPARPMPLVPLAAATGGSIAYGVFVLGSAVNLTVANMVPAPGRWVLILILFTGTVIYTIADAWATGDAPRGGYAFTKFCFLASLAAAVALNLSKLFFLIIIIPAILLLFLVYGLLSRWIGRRTRDPLPAAVCTALAFAWAIAVTFPIVGP